MFEGRAEEVVTVPDAFDPDKKNLFITDLDNRRIRKVDMKTGIVTTVVFVDRLIAAGFEARLISSMALARTREALHNGWDKNDPKDAQVILQRVENGVERAAGVVEGVTPAFKNN